MRSKDTPIVLYALSDPRTQAVRYIGQTIHHQRRYREHCAAIGRTPSTIWLRGLKAEGHVPTMTILETVTGRQEADERERHWIAFGVTNGWPLLNVMRGGHSAWLDTPIADQRRINMSRAKKGQPHPPFTPEARERMRQAHLGKRPSAETRVKLSAFQQSRKCSDATRERMRAAQLGKTHTDEARQRMAKAHKGKVLTIAHREALSAARKGRPQNPEHLANRLAALRSPETRARLSASIAKSWQKRKER